MDDRKIMELLKIQLEKIKPYGKNPRKNDDAVDIVAESIRQREYIAPIILDENNVILAGHTRYKALKKLGYKEAEVIIKRGLTEDQKKKYRLLDNKTNELAEWDFDLFVGELDGLNFAGLDLDWGLDLYPNNDECDAGEIENHENDPVEIVVKFSNIKEMKKIESEIRELIDKNCVSAKVRMSNENIESGKNCL